MLMVKRETETFGAVLSGDVVVRDVRRILVSFSQHRLFFPAASEAELREELKQRMLVFLATRALERINELRTRRSALEEQRRQLQAQLRALRGHAQGLRPLLSTNDADERRAAVLEQRLLQTEEELVAARKPLGTLDDYLEQIRQVLSQPEIYLQVRSLALRLNRLGVRLPLHIRIIRPAAAFRYHPVDVLGRILDVAGLAVDAVLGVDLQARVAARRRPGRFRRRRPGSSAAPARRTAPG
jgi:hypothetical protein